MEFVTTERLVLRNFTEEDLENLLDYRNDERCFRWQRGQFRQAEPLLNLIRSSSADDLNHDGKKHLAIARKEDNFSRRPLPFSYRPNHYFRLHHLLSLSSAGFCL